MFHEFRDFVFGDSRTLWTLLQTKPPHTIPPWGVEPKLGDESPAIAPFPFCVGAIPTQLSDFLRLSPPP
jgi:hypothetical protein